MTEDKSGWIVTVRCPECKKVNHWAAIIDDQTVALAGYCRHCGKWLDIDTKLSVVGGGRP